VIPNAFHMLMGYTVQKAIRIPLWQGIHFKKFQIEKTNYHPVIRAIPFLPVSSQNLNCPEYLPVFFSYKFPLLFCEYLTE